MMKFKYSKRIENLTDAYVRIVYEDGSHVEPLSKHYNGLKRTDMKSATIVSKDGKNLYTLDIVKNKLIYRKRNLCKLVYGVDAFTIDDPKRCILLATQGKIVFYWDSNEIKELKDWTKEEPYTCPNLRDDEK